MDSYLQLVEMEQMDVMESRGPLDLLVHVETGERREELDSQALQERWA